MAEQNILQPLMDQEDAPAGTAGKVFVNVYVVLSTIQCIAMIITGAIFFGDCPGSNILNVYLIVQGALLPAIPVLLCGCCQMKNTHYYTGCIIAWLLGTGWLIAGSRFLSVAECKTSIVYGISLGVIVVTWLFNGVYCVLCVIYKYIRMNQ